ncbi:MAG TPA: DUF5606 domain-containing protein [Puia sp.]|nr:DUF5606 domain-containing protein [Puia sp.]
MEYNKIVAVTGLPGLFELLASKADGAIVRSLEDKSTKFVSSRIHNFSHLESIEVFTKRENVNLVEVLKAIEASKENLPDEKNNDALKKYFNNVYPDMDFDRVYTSDLKKMIKWFGILRNNNVELKLSEASAEEQLIAEEANEEKVVAEEKAETSKAPKQKSNPEPEEKPKKAVAKKNKEEVKKEAEKEIKAKVKKEKEVEEKPKKAAVKKKSAKK